MKNNYIIVKHTDHGALFYNEDCNIFNVKLATKYTNKRTAANRMVYAKKYASGCDIVGEIEIVKL